ncbi:MAG: BON domain-containing protein [Holosporales bacterium]|nr:BON domain-containing protein [Holosporales bacterium]
MKIFKNFVGLRALLVLSIGFGSVLTLTRCTMTVIGGGVTAGAMARKEKTVGESISDMALAKRVAWCLYKFSPDVYARVGVNVQEGEVLLTGTLPSTFKIDRVEMAVWKIKHVKQVYNNIERSDIPPIRNYAGDAWITSQIKAKLLKLPGVRALNFTIRTVNNIVYILGIARTQDELDKVIDIASHVKGAARVVSYIRLSGETKAS